MGVHRRTIATLLDELRRTQRIQTRRAGRYAGLIVAFADVIYAPSAAVAPAEHLSGECPDLVVSDVIYSASAAATSADQPSAQPFPDVISSSPVIATSADQAPAQPVPDVISSAAPAAQPAEQPDSAVIYSAVPEAVSVMPAPHIDACPRATEETNHPSCVSSQHADDHSSTAPAPTLAEVIAGLLDSLPRRRLDDRTGQITRWPITLRRVLAALAEHYPAEWPVWQHAAPGTYRRVRAERDAEQFVAVRQLSAQALDQQLTNISRAIGRFEQRAAHEGNPALSRHWMAEANRRRGRLALLMGERQRRDEREAQRLERDGYTLLEQAEMLELIEATRTPCRRIGHAATIPASAPADTPVDAWSLIARLKARTVAGVGLAERHTGL
jgi:hypothetical protein